jgi:site-specific DNA recombinase
MLRVAIYIRVSTAEQKLHGLSLEAQKEALTKWAKDNDCEIVDYYIDAGKTARKKLSSRTELQRMLEDIKQDKIDLVVFTKLDRWFRNVRDYHKIQEVLEQHNVDWKTIFENYDTSTANGRLHINIMLSIAQDEADRTSERIKAVFQSKLQNGEAISGVLPIGYRIQDKKVVINEENCEIAIDVFHAYKYHQSQTKVFKVIMNKYGLSLCDKTIYRMLHNPIYAGTYRGHENFCPPLVSKELFDEVQDILNNKNIKYTPTERVFLFSGLLECAECKHKMVAHAQIRNYKSGRKEHAHYMCSQHYRRHTCSRNRVIYENVIEEYLLNNIEEDIKNYIHRPEVAGREDKRPKVNKSAITKKLEKLKELYVNDLIDIDMYKADYNKYIELLNAEEVPRKKRDIGHLKEFLNSDYRTIYQSLTREEKRIFWRGIVNKLVVDSENRIIPVFVS